MSEKCRINKHSNSDNPLTSRRTNGDKNTKVENQNQCGYLIQVDNTPEPS